MDDGIQAHVAAIDARCKSNQHRIDELEADNKALHQLAMPVSRYELDREQKLAAKDSEIALLKTNTYNDQKMLEMYGYIDGQLKDVREALCKQAVHNQRTEDSFTLVKQDVDCVRKEALSAVKMEAERRCCGDNALKTYVNATFYPKQVADVTTGTATSPQTLYDPLPKCCSCCNN